MVRPIVLWPRAEVNGRESWWGYEAAMRILARRFQVFAVDLRGQGRSTWTPGRYTLDIAGNDLVRFIDRVIARPTVGAGLSSGGTIAAWLSAYAAPGQIVAAMYEDAPLFASELTPAIGQSIRQGIGPMFAAWYKWLGPQWSIGNWEGMLHAMPAELPAPLLAGLAAMAPAGREDGPSGPPQDLRVYDPEWGAAFVSGAATAETAIDQKSSAAASSLASSANSTCTSRSGSPQGATRGQCC